MARDAASGRAICVRTRTRRTQGTPLRVGMCSLCIDPCADHVSCQALWWWECGQIVEGKPERVVQFLLVDTKLTPQIAGHIANHELVWERPGLATGVSDICNLKSHLFVSFSLHAFLQRFARFDEACDTAIPSPVPTSLACKQHALAIVDQDKDSRSDRWIDRKSTRLNSSHPSISYAVFCL